MRTAVILQARMGSHRLPGKVLADVAGFSILAHAIRRLRAGGLPVIVATTTDRQDDAVAREAEAHGATTFRGHAADVLGRYVAAAVAHDVTEIIRATADNPAVDIDAPARVLAIRERTGVDHVTECGLPVGAAVEAVSTRALMRAAAASTSAYDREHVTPFVRRGGEFTNLAVMAPGRLRCPSLSFTVDTAEDLRRMRILLEPFRYADALPSLETLIVAALRGRTAPSPEAAVAAGARPSNIDDVKGEVEHASAR